VSMFKKATKKGQSARMALFGPAGSGKTYTSLLIARGLVGPGGRVAVIDTERGSASKYSDVDNFDVCELSTFAPEEYVEALRGAAEAGYGVVVIDSLSHAWEGEGGILDQVDKRGGRFDAWKEMTPQTRALIDMILTYPGHVIVTMRSKTEYVVEKNERGKSEPRKIGLAPRFKDGMEYEFDIVGEMDDANVMRITKSRCVALSGKSISRPGKDLSRAILSWLGDAAPAEPPRREQKRESEPPRNEHVRTPETFDDCHEADELRAFCGQRRFRRLVNGKRGIAQEKCREAADRCGVSRDEALAWAGLDSDAAEAAQ